MIDYLIAERIEEPYTKALLVFTVLSTVAITRRQQQTYRQI